MCARQDKTALEAQDAEGKTALMWGADRGQEEVVRFLLAAGAAVDHQVCLLRAYTCSGHGIMSSNVHSQFVETL
eukprot:SAG11_NODE_3180_length_2628_cov_7.505733_3_plen_74_part_00